MNVVAARRRFVIRLPFRSVLNGPMALQGVLLNLLPGRRVYSRISGYVQGLSATVFFLAALESWHVTDWASGPEFLSDFALGPARMVRSSALARCSATPARWSARWVYARLAALGAVVTLALIAYFLSYWRYRALLLEGPAAAQFSSARHWSLIGALVREPRRAAILDFMDKTLSRSRTHRLVLLGYAGLAFGLLINSVLLARGFPLGNRLGYHLAIHDSLLAADSSYDSDPRPPPRALSLPMELSSNWIFRITESSGRAQWMSAVETFVVAYAIAPIFILLAPAAIMVLGWSVGLRMMTLQALASLSIFEMLFYSWQQLPFACSYAPGKRPLASIAGSYLAAIFFLAPALSILIAAASNLTGLFLFLVAGFTALWLWTRRQRRQGWGEATLIYEDNPDALADLGLRG